MYQLWVIKYTYDLIHQVKECENKLKPKIYFCLSMYVGRNWKRTQKNENNLLNVRALRSFNINYLL